MSDFLARAAGIANEHLDSESAALWLDLVRPAVALDGAATGEVVVARLGGRPRLPAGTPWPEWNGVGPLSFVGELNLAALSATGHDPGIPPPGAGRLAFFVLDDPDDYGFADPAHLDSFRVLHVPDDGLPVTPPPGTQTYAERDLTSRPTLTAPDAFHPALPAAFGIDAETDYPAWLDHPANGADLVDAMDDCAGTCLATRSAGGPSQSKDPSNSKPPTTRSDVDARRNGT